MRTCVNVFGQPVGFSLSNWQAPPFPPRAEMAGRLCRLEPLDPNTHAEPLFAANCLERDASGWTYLPYGPFKSLADFRIWCEEASQSKDPLFFAIVDLVSQRAVGLASYLRIDPRIGCIEVGHLKFSPALQRTPAATEAMHLMMQRAFGLGYRRYEWKCDALNAPSRAAALRLGFTFEGIFRQATVVRGRNRDTAWYSIIDAEWPAVHLAFECWLDPSNFDAQGRQKARLSVLTEEVRTLRSESRRTTAAEA